MKLRAFALQLFSAAIFIVLANLPLAFASECRTYSFLLKGVRRTIELCQKKVRSQSRPQLLRCHGDTSCVAASPRCKKRKAAAFGGSPIAQSCEDCGGLLITATNTASKNQEGLCSFSDGSWALAYDVFKKTIILKE